MLKIRTCDGDLRTRRGDMQPVSSRPDARRAKSRRRPPCARPPRGQCEGQRRRERATDRPTGARTSPRAFDDPFVDCSGPGSPARHCVRGRPLPGPSVSRRDASPPGEAIPDRRWSRARRACIPAPQRSTLSQRSTSPRRRILPQGRTFPRGRPFSPHRIHFSSVEPPNMEPPLRAARSRRPEGW